jgi:hypothetical protein
MPVRIRHIDTILPGFSHGRKRASRFPRAGSSRPGAASGGSSTMGTPLASGPSVHGPVADSLEPFPGMTA